MLWLYGLGIFPEVSMSFVVSSHAQITCSQRGKKCLSWTRVWWMSHESESARVGPYGLKLLQAIWMVYLRFSLSVSVSLSGWSIIIKVHKNIVFTQFHINQSQLSKWSRIRQSRIFSYRHPRNGNNINNSLARLAADHNFPKQYSHIYATESRRLANGRRNPTETSCEG